MSFRIPYAPSFSSVRVFTLACTILCACTPGDEGIGSYDIDVRSSNFSRDSGARCGLNTSAPMGDPRLGTFSFSISGENPAGETVILVGSFPEFTDTPAAGSFAVPGDVSVGAQLNGEEVEPITGTLVINLVGDDALEINMNALSNVRGTLLCRP